MVFWRNKKNQGKNDEERKDQRVLRHSRDADIEPPTEYDSDLSPDQKHKIFEETEMEILEDMEDFPDVPVKKN
ncbi:MAG: hypothetical protein HY370_06895 [Proteobacteria bacterium]|nr:hypothetical protein [Pseudomonadota bacterium]